MRYRRPYTPFGQLSEVLGPDGRQASTMREACEMVKLMKAEVETLREALEFYADPDTYFAIGFMSDPPCGDFLTDISECVDSYGLDQTKPGMRARTALAAREASKG